MSFSTIIVLGRYQSTSGPARGTVTFTRSALLHDTSTGELLLPYPVVAHLDSEGILRIALAANNDPTTTPADSGYSVQEAAGDCTRTYTIQVPYDSPNGTLDLVDKARGTPGGAVSLYAVTGGAGGGGSVTPPVTFTGTASAETILTVEAAAAQSAPYVIIKRDADWQGGTMIEGQDADGAQLWYADENGDGYFSHDLSLGRALHGAWFAMTDDCTITGSLGVTSLNSSGAVDGASAVITGDVGAGSVTTTGTVAAGSVGVTAGVTVGTTVQVGNGTSAGVMVNVDGSIQVFNSSEPATPTGGGVFWVEAGALKYKGSSGTVTTLGAA